jgi:peptidoglycan/LPS O-acetylase OafA/YrhL
MHQDPRSRSAFVPELEALRGIAALFVAIYHSFVWMPINDQPVSIMSLFDVHGLQAFAARAVIAITNGTSWVDIFFLLSGYVLAISLHGKTISISSWLPFMVKRTMRIVPVYLAVLVLVCMALALISAGDSFADAYDWYPRWKADNLSAYEIISNALLVQTWINPPSWTLRVEMIVAALFPFIFFISIKLSTIANILILSTVAAVGYYFRSNVYIAWLCYMSLFWVGVLGQRVGGKVAAGIPEKYLSTIALLSFLCIVLPNIFHITFPIAREVPAAIGGFLLIAILASGRECCGLRWLKSSIPRYLGRVSFSFYLLHYMTLYVLTSAYTSHFGFSLLSAQPLFVVVSSAAISIVICLPLASVLYKYIERPFADFGRRLTTKHSKERFATPA